MLTLITVAVLPGSRRRHLLRFVATFAVVVITLLLASSQSLLAFPDYISTSIRMASGHQTAFVQESLGRVLLVRTSLYRALRRYITFDGATRYQLTPLNAGEPLLLRAPPKVDLPLPYALAPNARSIAFSRESGFPSPPETVEITFTTMKVEPAPQGSVRGFSGASGRE